MDPSKLLFSPPQEQELGEIVRQQMESRFRNIEEGQLTGYLKAVGERVSQHLPETGLRYEFLLYDQPEIQAFSMPGGRVYVSRKMAAYLRNEDELAGLLRMVRRSAGPSFTPENIPSRRKAWKRPESGSSLQII